MEILNYKIYTLKVIGEDKFRYIGLTKVSLSKRLNGHIIKCKNEYSDSYKDRWIRKNDYNIEINLIEENILSLKEANDREVYWIKYYRDLGYDLVNSTDGGDGTTGRFLTDSQKQNLREKNLGKTLSDEHKKKIGERNKGKVRNEEVKAKLRKAKENVSEETRSKMSFNKYKEWLIKNNYNIDGLTEQEIISLREKIKSEVDCEKDKKQQKIENERLEKKLLEEEIKKQKEDEREQKRLEKIKKKEFKKLEIEEKIKNGLLKKVIDKNGKEKIVPVLTEEHKKIISVYNKTHVQSEESKRKRVESNKKTREQNGKEKYRLTEAQKENLRQKNLGKKQSQESIEKRRPKCRGENNGCAKINEDIVRQIRKFAETKEKSNREIANFFNMEYSTICKIIQRKLWKHVE